jgi:hypothetical protein
VPERPEKTCVTCGRTFAWRKRWARSWDEVRYCGERCRRSKVDPVDRALEEATLTLLAARPRGATICPSEAARAVAGEDDETWRPLMERARCAARRLVERGVVEITQRGVAVEPSAARGPIRVRARG